MSGAGVEKLQTILMAQVGKRKSRFPFYSLLFYNLAENLRTVAPVIETKGTGSDKK